MTSSGIAWGVVASALAVIVVLFGLDGARYYGTPLRVRGYATSHRLLRPSGPVGQTLGVVGTALMVVPFVYMGRKRITRLKPIGAVKSWLEIHLFCGIVGPVLVTLHTSFKFNGIISTAYWSMVLVMLSGFAGRYLYVRIPRSLRGNEMSRAELEADAERLKATLAASGIDAGVLRRIDAFEAGALPHSARDLSLSDLLLGEARIRRQLHALARELADGGLRYEIAADVVRVTAERATLMRRAAYLQRTRRLFDLWHVFHLPLVYLMLVIAAAHISLVLYMGYVPFRW